MCYAQYTKKMFCMCAMDDEVIKNTTEKKIYYWLKYY